VAIELEMLDRAERRLAVSLALIAGYVDAYGIVALGVYVSFMSGNTTQTGAQTGQGHFVAAVPSALAIMFFVIGNFAGASLTHSGLRRSRPALLGVVASLLAVIIGVTSLGSLNGEVAIAVVALAMGMMNTTLSQVGGETVSLTFVTGDLAPPSHGSHAGARARRAGIVGYPSLPRPHCDESVGWLPDRRVAVRSSDPALWSVGPVASVPDSARPGRAQRCR
jgi:hypothetical protein